MSINTSINPIFARKSKKAFDKRLTIAIFLRLQLRNNQHVRLCLQIQV